MASIAVSAAGAATTGGLAAALGPFGAIGLVLGASLVDQLVIMPALQGKGRGAAQTPRLAGLPVGSNEPGAPRIWAIGNRVRVPCHVLWQDTKTREINLRQKGSSGITQRLVTVSALIALNDRQTSSMQQLVGNGKLLVWRDRNLVEVRTNAMSAAQDGARIAITMADQSDPDLSETFEVGDIVKLSGFVEATSTPDINGTYWSVQAVTAHSASATSTITLDPADGQTVTGVNSSGGTVFAPALIERVDDALVFDTPPATITFPATSGGPRIYILPVYRDPREVFTAGDEVVANGAGFSGIWQGRVLSVTATQIAIYPVQQVSTTPGISGWDRIEFSATNQYPGSLFPSTFDIEEHYHDGSETQDPDSLIEDAEGIGNVSAYRGIAYQGLEDFEVTQFGNALPFSLEAIIDVDPGMTWGDAIRAVLERAGIPADRIDVEDMAEEPFEGFYIRGAAPTVTTIQPLLVAKQLLSQDRDGVLSFFAVENADVVSIENGAQKTALGARRFGEQATDDKVGRQAVALEDLPTSIGIRHQDPDNAYAPGYQSFGLRNPSGIDWQNHREVDLSSLVLRRKDARNLATTLMRRAWINSTTVDVMLDARYIDLLENDLITLTDDDGYDLTCRIVKREIGANLLVKITAVLEDVALEVTGSAVQGPAGTYTPPPVQPALLTEAVMDLPPLTPAEAAVPTLRLACGPQPGAVFQGARLYESRDGGTTWVPVATFDREHTIGTITTTMDAGTVAETYGSTGVTFDDATAVTVELESLGWAGGLQTVLPIEAELAGRNWCAIEDLTTGRWEVCAFTTATQTGTRTYELTDWLRGLRGTHPDAGITKPAGGRFVLLDGWDFSGRSREVQDRPNGLSLLYRFVPVGATVEEVESFGITPTWRSASPLPPRKLTATIDGGTYDATIETENWCKQPLPLGTVGPYPMDESFEEYVFTFYDPTGAAARRTKTLSVRNSAGQVVGSPTLRDRFVVYTAAEQTADGYTPAASNTFWVDVQQVGDFGTSVSNPRQVTG